MRKKMLSTRRLIIFSLVTTMLAAVAGNPDASTDVIISDSLYSATHPRLLFTQDELPALNHKISNGKRDREAFAYACSLLQDVYPGYDNEQLLSHSYGVGTFPLLYVIAWLDCPQDTTATRIGRQLVDHTVINYTPDDNVYYAPLRLRGLALGYDAFYTNTGDSVRAAIRSEMEAYIDTMLTTRAYEYWRHSPFLANITTMIAASLGLAAICLDGETAPARVGAALEMADDYINTWLEFQLDPDGAYNEGAMYAGWCMRNLCYYFEARKRYDGRDYSGEPEFQNLQNWLAFSLLPTGRAEVNNINDAATLNHPWSRHHTYLDWAQSVWGSGLASWLWERLRGPDLGFDSGELADPAATIIWHRDIMPTSPNRVLPNHGLWQDRGLYYYRSGWQADSTSDDIVLSFYSGKFYGGHAQEDQNNFTLYGYGRRFAIDHGYGLPGRESEAHNMVFVDGRGQHHAGGSVGTDGEIREYLLSDFADYIFGDATAAYSTYSEFNRNGYPFPENDWSPGHDGGNPVEYAHRRLLVVHGPKTPPYLVLMDDVKKDDSGRSYEWRLHTDSANEIGPITNPVRIGDDNGWMDLHVVTPEFHSSTVTTSPYNNDHDDPDATVISLAATDTAGRFTVVMLMGDGTTVLPACDKGITGWGEYFQLVWPDGVTDRFVRNRTGAVVRSGDIETDAAAGLLRNAGGSAQSYIVCGATTLTIDGISHVQTHGGRLGVAVSAARVVVDTPGVPFRIRAPGIAGVSCRGKPLPVRRDGEYLVSIDRIAGPERRVAVDAFPNPFNASVTVVVDLFEPAPAEVAVFDVAGRLVRTLWSGDLPAGPKPFVWEGRDNRGVSVSSGVYLVRLRASGSDSVKKLVLVK
jgi:hypothetical protein